jgi:hypothetical protein
VLRRIKAYTSEPPRGVIAKKVRDEAMRCLVKCYGDDHGYGPDRREIYYVTAHSLAFSLALPKIRASPKGGLLHNKFISFCDSWRGLEYKLPVTTATPQQSQRIVTELLSFLPTTALHLSQIYQQEFTYGHAYGALP